MFRQVNNIKGVIVLFVVGLFFFPNYVVSESECKAAIVFKAEGKLHIQFRSTETVS